MLETLTWHCCMCCNPANGRVDIEELLAYKIQLHGVMNEMRACQPTETNVPQKNSFFLNIIQEIFLRKNTTTNKMTFSSIRKRVERILSSRGANFFHKLFCLTIKLELPNKCHVSSIVTTAAAFKATTLSAEEIQPKFVLLCCLRKTPHSSS